MKLRYTITQEHYADFNMFHMLNSDAAKALIRKTRIWPPAVWLLICLLFCGYFFYTSGRFPTAVACVVAGMSALWYALYPLCHRKSLERRIGRWLADGGGREFVGEVAMDLLDDRLRAEDAGGVREVLYDRVERLVENKNCLYIYIGTVSAFLVPLEAFADAEARREFRDALEEKARAARAAQNPA